MTLKFVNYMGFYPRINSYKSFVNNITFVFNLFNVSMQTLIKMNLKLNLGSSLSRVPFQINMKRNNQFTCSNVFTRCENISCYTRIKELKNASVLPNIDKDSLPRRLKALIEKGYPCTLFINSIVDRRKIIEN